MSILSGYTRYKRHILTSEGYKLCSQWTSSNSVVMGDGTDDTNTLETNLGSIKGITDSLTATSSNIALSASAGNNLQTQLDTLNSNFNNYEIKIITSTGNTSEVGTFSFNYTDELPNGGALFLIYTANSNYWCRLYGFSDGNCVLGIADFNMQNSANTQHTVYSYWLVKKVNRLFDSINPQF